MCCSEYEWFFHLDIGWEELPLTAPCGHIVRPHGAQDAAHVVWLRGRIIRQLGGIAPQRGLDSELLIFRDLGKPSEKSVKFFAFGSDIIFNDIVTEGGSYQNSDIMIRWEEVEVSMSLFPRLLLAVFWLPKWHQKLMIELNEVSTFSSTFPRLWYTPPYKCETHYFWRLPLTVFL